MRFREIRGGLQMPVSALEQELIEHIQDNKGLIEATLLDEFKGELARKMVSKGLLDQVRQDGSLYYVVNELEEIWRE